MSGPPQPERHTSPIREPVDREIVLAPVVEHLQPVEDVRRVEILEVPPRQQIRVGVVDVLDERVEHRGLRLEGADLKVDLAAPVTHDPSVVGEILGRRDLGLGGVVQPDDVLVVVGVMARETDDRLLAVLGEAAAVVDLDVEGVHPHLGVDLSGFEMPLVDLDRVGAVVEPALLHAHSPLSPLSIKRRFGKRISASKVVAKSSRMFPTSRAYG